jgi:hypothetical protein
MPGSLEPAPPHRPTLPAYFFFFLG